MLLNEQTYLQRVNEFKMFNRIVYRFVKKTLNEHQKKRIKEKFTKNEITI